MWNLTRPVKTLRRPLFDNANRVTRIRSRIPAYRKLLLQALRKGVPVSDLVRTQFPFILPDAVYPPLVTMEFTNICNLRCVYCSSPLGLRPRGMMTRDTFRSCMQGFRALQIKRVRVIGNGEPTLHPDFSDFIEELVNTVKFVSVLSNGHWRNLDISRTLVKTDVVEISIDAGEESEYEDSRVGGQLDTVKRNLIVLRERREQVHSKCLINIRLMLRPSQKPIESQQLKFWQDYADTVMPQYIVKRKNVDWDKDIFYSVHQQASSYPTCTLPFKALDIIWTGDVPLCSGSATQIGPPGLIVGNVNTGMLEEMWNGETMNKYRDGHRHRKLDQIPICKGCVGC